MSLPQEQEPTQAHGRTHRPLFLIGGFFLLGLALALFIFGSGWGQKTAVPASSSILEQVPASANSGSRLAQLPDNRLSTGDPAYDFSLVDLEGNEVRLADFHGRPVILNFWATWCAPCRLEMPELQAAYSQYQDDGLVILALNQEESPQLVRKFFYDDMGLTFTPLLDGEGLVADLYGVNRLFPSSFFINGDGEITAVHRGMLVASQIEAYLAETIDRSE
ncbi:MAG TPA: TlpA disulfide reductase family protein [Chloroflexota bacterium]|nr:TlpA disulfide reductase family protein [Chloroflexota bacterium]